MLSPRFSWTDIYNSSFWSVFCGILSPCRFFIEALVVVESRCLPVRHENLSLRIFTLLQMMTLTSANYFSSCFVGSKWFYQPWAKLSRWSPTGGILPNYWSGLEWFWECDPAIFRWMVLGNFACIYRGCTDSLDCSWCYSCIRPLQASKEAIVPYTQWNEDRVPRPSSVLLGSSWFVWCRFLPSAERGFYCWVGMNPILGITWYYAPNQWRPRNWKRGEWLGAGSISESDTLRSRRGLLWNTSNRGSLLWEGKWSMTRHNMKGLQVSYNR